MNENTKNPDRVDRDASKKESKRADAQKEAIGLMSTPQSEKEEDEE